MLLIDVLKSIGVLFVLIYHYLVMKVIYFIFYINRLILKIGYLGRNHMTDLKKGDIATLKIARGKDISREQFIIYEISKKDNVTYARSELGKSIPITDLVLVKSVEKLSIKEKNKATLFEILNSVYKDNWDYYDGAEDSLRDSEFGGISLSDNTIWVVLRYPKVIITNSKGAKHEIRDLFVTLHFDSQYRLLEHALYGTRTTTTPQEADRRYSHSHLSSGLPLGMFSPFCTGGSISTTNVALGRVKEKDVCTNKMNYELLFEVINSFVAWESLEGGPYTKIRDIPRGNSSVRSSYETPVAFSRTNNKSVRTSVLEFLKHTNFEIPISYNFGETFPIRIDKETFRKSLTNHFIENVDKLGSFTNRILSHVLNICSKSTLSNYRDKNFTIDTLKEAIRIKNEGNVSNETKEVFQKMNGSYHIKFRGSIVENRRLIKEEDVNDLDNIVFSATLAIVLSEHYLSKFYKELYDGKQKFIDDLKGNNNTSKVTGSEIRKENKIESN